MTVVEDAELEVILPGRLQVTIGRDKPGGGGLGWVGDAALAVGGVVVGVDMRAVEAGRLASN